jgi:glycosyltransferase involved in cell wall biosynthesis
MKLSVIVPVGRPETAERTLASILRQGGGTEMTELILVGVDTGTLAARFPDPRIRQVRLAQRRNPAATRIAGVGEARGDWFLFVDDDIELDEHFLERLAAIAGEERVGAIGARLPGAEHTYFSRVTALANFWSQQAPSSGERDWLYSAVLAVPRRVYEEVGGFAPELTIGEDVDLTRRIRQAGYRLLYRAGLVGYHRHRRTTFHRALAYSWQNGGLALAQFQENPQVRAWSAGSVLRTLVLSLAGTLRANGLAGGGILFWYLPGIILFYLVFALSLETHYQRFLHDVLLVRNGADGTAPLPCRNPFIVLAVANRIQGRWGLAFLCQILAVARQNWWLVLSVALLLFVLVTSACASA